MGETADGPGEPSTARLPDGTLLCVFRADASSCVGPCPSEINSFGD